MDHSFFYTGFLFCCVEHILFRYKLYVLLFRREFRRQICEGKNERKTSYRVGMVKYGRIVLINSVNACEYIQVAAVRAEKLFSAMC